MCHPCWGFSSTVFNAFNILHSVKQWQKKSLANLMNLKRFANVLPVQICTFKKFAEIRLRRWLLQTHAPFAPTCGDWNWQLWFTTSRVNDWLVKGSRQRIWSIHCNLARFPFANVHLHLNLPKFFPLQFPKVTNLLNFSPVIILTLYGSCDAGEVFSRMQVIVSVPLTLLKNGSITFTPSLAPRKQLAIRRLGAGLVEKVLPKSGHVELTKILF